MRTWSALKIEKDEFVTDKQFNDNSPMDERRLGREMRMTE